MVFTFNENLRILNIIKNWIENFDNSDSDNLFQKKIIAVDDHQQTIMYNAVDGSTTVVEGPSSCIKVFP